MKIVDLRPDLRMVLDDGPGQAYLLRRGSDAVLVDTGIAGQGDVITEALRGWGLDRESLTHVVLTHWHPDHAGSAAELAAWPNVRIWAHRGDAPIIRGDNYGSFPALTHAEEGLYAHIAGTIPDAAPSRVDRELDDDEILDEIDARVLSTPGHTDGSIALHFPNEAVLFTGDIATEHQGQVVLGPFNHDRALARESFRRFADIDVDTVCFGHGQPLRGDDTALLGAAATADEVPDPLG
ncbi:MBL fold metallo-hydrolase [Streptomyces lushanensis]|uniref:MBL fold metallo-hydrolase n=1 Tax=Streptomyces lushanensis TaxID=1434255 RepID=UPI000836B428|nr:MBL fold metallo-hydrolase [Streptomyces lushanensis]